MQRVFVCLLSGAPGVDDRVLAVTRALVDFIYYAQFQLHTSESLAALQSCLDIFHQHKQVFIELGVREHFNIPKFHSLLHYFESILALGSLDGYNTESPERLHIDYAKEAYRASNKRDYVEQMTTWLQRQEAIDLRSAFLIWTNNAVASLPLPADEEFDEDDDAALIPPESNDSDDDESIVHTPQYHIAKNCPLSNISIPVLEAHYGAVDFLPALASFLKKSVPTQSFIQLGRMDRFDLYKQLVINTPTNPYLSSEARSTRIRATAAVPAKGRKSGTPARFDTALVRDPDDPSGV